MGEIIALCPSIHQFRVSRFENAEEDDLSINTCLGNEINNIEVIHHDRTIVAAGNKYLALPTALIDRCPMTRNARVSADGETKHHYRGHGLKGMNVTSIGL